MGVLVLRHQLLAHLYLVRVEAVVALWKVLVLLQEQQALVAAQVLTALT
jgi:hypothetical protein